MSGDVNWPEIWDADEDYPEFDDVDDDDEE